MEKADDPVRRKDLWDKVQAVGALLTPITVAVFGYFVTNAIKDREIAVEYVRVAAETLRQPASSVSPGMRLWAFNVLRTHSPAPMPPELEASALNKSLGQRWLGPGGNVDNAAELSFDSTDFNSDLVIRVDGVIAVRTGNAFTLRSGQHHVEFVTPTGDVVCDAQVAIGNFYTRTVTCDRQARKMVIGAQRKVGSIPSGRPH